MQRVHAPDERHEDTRSSRKHEPERRRCTEARIVNAMMEAAADADTGADADAGGGSGRGCGSGSERGNGRGCGNGRSG